MSVLKNCAGIPASQAMPGALVAPAQTELAAYYKPWTDFAGGIGPDPGILPPDATVAYAAIWPIAVTSTDGSTSCVDETGASSTDKQTIFQLASLLAMGATAGYLAKNPSPAQLQYWTCDDGRRVPRSANQGIDPDIARSIDCGKTVAPSAVPSSSSPLIGIGMAAVAMIGLYLVLK